MMKIAGSQRMKKTYIMRALSIFLVIMTVFSLFPVAAINAESFINGDYAYEIVNGKAIIKEYRGPGGDVRIPAVLGSYDVTEIDGAFEGCASLTSITIPNSVTTIGDNSFALCTSLTSITIPNSVTTIGDDSFALCTSLTEITIPESVITIGSCIIRFTGITSITIPKNVSTIDSKAFLGCKGLKSIDVDSNNAKFSSDDGVLLNKDKTEFLRYPEAKSGAYIIPETVTTINYFAFSYCTSLTSVTIPKGVTTINDNTFSYCTSLTSITIPESVTTIGPDTFSYCTSLTSITIPEGVTTIGPNTFHGCASLTSITIPESVTTINYFAFSYCTSLTSITIPKGVTTISPATFYYCTSLKSVTIPDGVTTIEDFAFDSCENLSSINIPESVISIGSSAFYCCKSLTSVKIPKDVKTIEEYTFYGCTSLTSVNIPESVTRIGKSAFFSCTSLKNINIPKGITRIEAHSFRSCSSLTNIDIPESVTAIGDWAFYGCSSLTSIDIPESVKVIGQSVFGGCINLTSAKIPEAMTIIGSAMFSGCTSLTSVNIPDSVKEIRFAAFLNCPNLTLIIGNNLYAKLYAQEQNINHVISSPAFDQSCDNDNVKISALENIIFSGGQFNVKPLKVPKDLDTDIKAEFGDNVQIAKYYNITLTATDNSIIHPNGEVALKIKVDSVSGESLRPIIAYVANGIMIEEMPTKVEDGYAVVYPKDADIHGNYILVLMGNDADYTKVNEALSKKPANLSFYTAESVAALATAEKNVIWDKKFNEQELVDSWAEAIEDAINALVKKFPGEYILCGDVNYDGNISDQDAILLARFLAGWKIEDIICLGAADINGDTEIDDTDAISFARYFAGWKISTKIGNPIFVK